MVAVHEPCGAAFQNERNAGALSETLGVRPPASDDAAWREGGFVWTLLPRHGKRPALFLGRGMLRADSRHARRAAPFQYVSDITIFELFCGGFVTAVRHFQAADDRVFWQDAWFSAEPSGVILSLRNHGSAGVWHDAQAADVGARLTDWLALLRTLFGEARAA